MARRERAAPQSRADVSGRLLLQYSAKFNLVLLHGVTCFRYSERELDEFGIEPDISEVKAASFAYRIEFGRRANAMPGSLHRHRANSYSWLVGKCVVPME